MAVRCSPLADQPLWDLRSQGPTPSRPHVAFVASSGCARVANLSALRHLAAEVPALRRAHGAGSLGRSGQPIHPRPRAPGGLVGTALRPDRRGRALPDLLGHGAQHRPPGRRAGVERRRNAGRLAGARHRRDQLPPPPQLPHGDHRPRQRSGGVGGQRSQGGGHPGAPAARSGGRSDGALRIRCQAPVRSARSTPAGTEPGRGGGGRAPYLPAATAAASRTLRARCSTEGAR